MKKILILYPEVFNCYSKFERKVRKILQNINNFSIVYPDDPNGFIKSLFKDSGIELIKSSEKADITHSIIFDDGNEFPEIVAEIQNNKKPLRLIHTPLTRVINIKDDKKLNGTKSTETYEYIGRGSYWGNPYAIDGENNRDEVIRKYKFDFDNDLFPKKEKKEVYKLFGKTLGCFCKPDSCHGDILANFLNSWDDGK